MQTLRQDLEDLILKWKLHEKTGYKPAILAELLYKEIHVKEQEMKQWTNEMRYQTPDDEGGDVCPAL